MSKLTDEELVSLDLAGRAAREDIAEYTSPRGTPTYDDRRIGRMMAREDWVALAVDAVTEIRSLRQLLTAIEHDFDGAIAAHDASDPRHPIHGGQHHNGRCCAFGNVTPGALMHMWRLRDAIRAALEAKGGAK